MTPQDKAAIVRDLQAAVDNGEAYKGLKPYMIIAIVKAINIIDSMPSEPRTENATGAQKEAFRTLCDTYDSIIGYYPCVMLCNREVMLNAIEAYEAAKQPLSSIYTVRHDDYGFPCAIERDGYTVLHLNPGTVRNKEELPQIMAILNGQPPAAALASPGMPPRDSAASDHAHDRNVADMPLVDGQPLSEAESTDLRRTMRDLIKEQSCGEWDDETIDKDADTFTTALLEKFEIRRKP